MRRRAGWLRWLAANLGLLLALLPFPLLVVLGVDAVTGWSDARPGTIVDGYVFFVVYPPLTWPVYLVLVALTSGPVVHPRRWAVALSPVLGLPLLPFLVLVTAPPIAAIAVPHLWLARTSSPTPKLLAGAARRKGTRPTVEAC